MALSIVIARYNENLDWITCLAKIPCKIYVYNKSDNVFEKSPVPHRMKDRVIVENLPNVGRETNTYLHHICQYYESLSETIIFLQGDPHFHCTNIESSLANWKSFAGKNYQCLSSGYNSPNRNTNTWSWTRALKTTEFIWEKVGPYPNSIYGTGVFPETPDPIYRERLGISYPYDFIIKYLGLPTLKRYQLLGLAACFSTTRSAIHRIKLHKYQKLRAFACTADLIEWRRTDRVSGKEPPDSPGFIMEHLWSYILRRESYDTITELVRHCIPIPRRLPMVVLSIRTNEIILCTNPTHEFEVNLEQLTIFWKDSDSGRRELVNVLYIVPLNPVILERISVPNKEDGSKVIKSIMSRSLVHETK